MGYDKFPRGTIISVTRVTTKKTKTDIDRDQTVEILESCNFHVVQVGQSFAGSCRGGTETT